EVLELHCGFLQNIVVGCGPRSPSLAPHRPIQQEAMPTAVNRKAGTLRFVHGGPNHRQRLGCAPRGGKGSSESTTNGGVHMSKRFLMRLGKTPFEVFDGFDTLDRNTI